MPDRYVVFGNPVSHSKSPRIHAMFAAQSGQDMHYEAQLAPIDGFSAAVRKFATGGGKGANITVPFKEEACRLATTLSPRAQAAGAVNTLSFAGDTLLGDNTDGAGLVRDLTYNLGCDLRGKRILLLGAGGAARGVILPLLEQQPADLLIANRTEEKARHLSLACNRSGLQTRGCGYGHLVGEPPFDLIINATSAGLSDSELPLPPHLFATGSLAYEMLYGRDTPFMQQARGAGVPDVQVADGLGMLVEQAAEAFFIWRGVRPETRAVLAALR